MAIACSAALTRAAPKRAAAQTTAAPRARNNGEGFDSICTRRIYHNGKERSGVRDVAFLRLEPRTELGYGRRPRAAKGRHVVAVIGEETACGKTPKLGCAARAAGRARAGGK